MDGKSVKIAAVSDDGVTISDHFGRAPEYVIVEVKNGNIIGKEVRPKTGHHTFAAHQENTPPGEKHGYDSGAQVRHASMMDTIADCQVLLAGGMGWGAHDALRSRGIDVVVTDVDNIEEAARLYLKNELPNLQGLLH